MRLQIVTLACTNSARKAVEAGNLPELHATLYRILTESPDISTSLVSTVFVEDFLAPLLSKPEQAQAVLDTMRDVGYGEHARPMLLAFEAAIHQRANMLDEMEPEIQRAAKLMYERLTGKPKKRKTPSKRTEKTKPT